MFGTPQTFVAWRSASKSLGHGDAAVQLAIVLFGDKVLRQIRTAAFWKETISVLPEPNSLSVIIRNIASSLSRFSMLLALSPSD